MARAARARGRAVLGLLLATAGAAAAAESGVLRLNPFGDPFVRVTAGAQAASCAVPRGPAYTDAEIRQEAHYRAERGTSCWLAGRCSEPNAYRYDARIAEAAVAALRAEPALAGSAIWLIAERRFVLLQGCVADAQQAARAEAIAQALPEVEAVINSLALPGEAPRYPVAAP